MEALSAALIFKPELAKHSTEALRASYSSYDILSLIFFCAHNLFPNLQQVEASTLRSINDLTFGNLPLESQAQIRQLAHNLNQLLQHMNGKDEIFTVGSFSRIVGTELEALNSAKTRRKVKEMFVFITTYK